MKIYEIQFKDGEKMWIAANTAIEALKFHATETENELIDLDNEDDIVELPPDKWKDYKVKNTEYDESDPDDWKELTFGQAVEGMVDPDWIATTIF